MRSGGVQIDSYSGIMTWRQAVEPVRQDVVASDDFLSLPAQIALFIAFSIISPKDSPRNHCMGLSRFKAAACEVWRSDKHR